MIVSLLTGEYLTNHKYPAIMKTTNTFHPKKHTKAWIG